MKSDVVFQVVGDHVRILMSRQPTNIFQVRTHIIDVTSVSQTLGITDKTGVLSPNTLTYFSNTSL